MTGKIIKTHMKDLRFIVDINCNIIGAIKGDEFYTVGDIYKDPSIHEAYHKMQRLVRGKKNI